MKERPILFSSPMVRAILAGTKTQTRRIVKPQPEAWVCNDGHTHYALHLKDGSYHDVEADGLGRVRAECPYGQPGDRLWVREAWRIGAWNENEGVVAIDYCDGPREEWLLVPDREVFERLWQQSTDDAIKALGSKDRYRWEPGQSPCRQRPSIHMPRWASRIDLEIVAVRVERLQDISEADALAEGIRHSRTLEGYHVEQGACFHASDARESYATLWEQINGQGSWTANPWVWVLKFKRVKP